MPSAYAPDEWRQGATIVPKVLATAEVARAWHISDQRSVTTIRSDKPPRDSVQSRTGEIPEHRLTAMFTSRHLLPFGVATERFETVIIPCDGDGELLPTETARQTTFWAELDDLYGERRGMGGNTPRNLIAQIDYAGKLSKQLPLRSQSGCLVVYPWKRLFGLLAPAVVISRKRHGIPCRSPHGVKKQDSSRSCSAGGTGRGNRRINGLADRADRRMRNASASG